MNQSKRSRTYLAKWRSEKAEREYRELDEALWRKLTNSPPDAVDLETRFGLTRAYRWPGSGPAVVCLHGMGDTSIRWIPYAEQLDTADFYAIDIMGDVGRSLPTVGFTEAAGYATWLDDAIDGLNLTAPHLVGESLGGYIALLYASSYERSASVVGLDPVGLVDLRMARFMAWAFATAAASFVPGPTRRTLAKRLHQPLVANKDEIRVYSRGQLGHPPKLPPQPVFTDEQLASITVPVHVLAAGKSAAFDGQQMTERVRAKINKGTAVLLPDAGHSLSISRFDDCLAAIRSTVAV